MAKGKEREVLYRVVKFEVRPTEAQLAILRQISDNLWLVWDTALQARFAFHKKHFEPLYERIREAAKAGDAAEVASLRKQLAGAYKEHKLTLFDQINALTPRRARDAVFAAVPRNWQEETLDAVDGAWKSWIALRKNGDHKARPPRLRNEWHFCEIPGRWGFKLAKDGRSVSLSCGDIGKGVPLVFTIPEAYQARMLARATKVKKFILYRDVRDLREPGRFWLSLAYEIPKPVTLPFAPGQATYVSLGASWIGVVSPNGEEVIPLWRSDKHWKPLADSAEERAKRRAPGSRTWKKRMAARRKMFRLMGAQQKLDRRRVVTDLLARHGPHFVVTELVVRAGKKGALADGRDPERGGALGLNWSAQNTGSLAYLVQWLEEKTKEHGGTVRKHRIAGPLPEGQGRDNKVAMARALRESFLASYTTAA